MAITRNHSLSKIILTDRILVGGQALIEGVMMRVPGAYAAVVRTPSGDYETIREEFVSSAEKSAFWKNPILRGMSSLFEALKIGYKTLQFSAEQQLTEEEKAKENKVGDFFSTVLAVLLAVGFFLIAPLAVAKFIQPNLEQYALTYNLLSGVIRVVFLLLYLLAISMIKDVRRVFEYHGAEHKTVFAFEKGVDLNVEQVKKFSRFHPRCGTSFLLIVAIVGILVFAGIDAIVIGLASKTTLWMRILYHLPFVPLVAGISYEVIRLSSRFDRFFFVRWLTLPGLWLQRITTREPSDDQIEVAIESLKLAFGDQIDEVQGKQFVADAIG